MTILIFILILSLLVFVHELGHFWSARRSGVGVLEFGFGFPPKIWGIKRGPTEYTINLIPFGGFVRLEGEVDNGSQSPTSFARAPMHRKFLILAAGVIMNYLLAWALLTLVYTAGVTVQPVDQPVNRWQQYSQQHTEAYISDTGAAHAAGLNNGDTIVSINDQSFSETDQLIAYTQANNYPPLTIIARRGQREFSLQVTPQRSDQQTPVYGLGLSQIAVLQYPWYIAPWYGLTTTVSFTGQTFAGFGRLIHDLVISGKVSPDLAGPVGIAILTGEFTRLGFIPVLQFMAVLSISLAVINFMPLPALDGGRAVFVMIEKIRGRQINPRVEGAIHAVGFYLLLALVVLISIRDVHRFDVVDRLSKLFH